MVTQVLSSDFKTTPVYFNWNFLTYWSAITNFKILRELGRGENDIQDLLVKECNACARGWINVQQGSFGISDF